MILYEGNYSSLVIHWLSRFVHFTHRVAPYLKFYLILFSVWKKDYVVMKMNLSKILVIQCCHFFFVLRFKALFVLCEEILWRNLYIEKCSFFIHSCESFCTLCLGLYIYIYILWGKRFILRNVFIDSLIRSLFNILDLKDLFLLFL